MDMRKLTAIILAQQRQSDQALLRMREDDSGICFIFDNGNKFTITLETRCDVGIIRNVSFPPMPNDLKKFLNSIVPASSAYPYGSRIYMHSPEEHGSMSIDYVNGLSYHGWRFVISYGSNLYHGSHELGIRVFSRILERFKPKIVVI
jgi:hypothetical protein